MPTYEVTSPDGKTWEITAPDGATQDQVLAYAKQQWAASLKAPDAPGQTQNRDIASQLGLTARAGIKGLAALPAIGADAVGGLLNKAQDLTLGQGRGVRFQQTLPALEALMDRAGLPSPDTPLQRVVSKGLELGAGAGGAAKLMERGAAGASGAARDVLTRLADDPVTQVASGTGAGLAGQQSKESGGGAGSQFVSALAGGLTGAGLVGGAKAAATAVTQRQALQPVEIERRISVALQRQGIDPASITPAMRAALMEDVRQAMKQPGALDDAALARLADYRRLGLTPTRGRVTLDPYDVTREQNAMRMAAATGNRDANLPTIAQQNNQRLLSSVEDLRPINDRVALGERVISPILARDAAMAGRVNQLYSQARDSSGRSLPLEGGTFTRMANDALDQANVGSFLPADIARKMNDIAAGKYPLTVDVAEQLKTSIGNLQRNSNDGNVRTALGIVRRALDEAPLQNDRLFNPGNVPAIPGMVPPSVAAAGEDALNAFREARGAARERFSWQESAPAISRALDGAAPDNFIRDQIISRSASAADVERLARELGGNPQAINAIRSGIVQHLKDAAIGRGNDAATGNFSGRQWLAALNDIPVQKLRQFFDAAEIEQLRAIGRVGAVETFQPRGSAVNNSNTAAGSAAILQALTKYLQPVANKLPLGGAAITDPLNNITLSVMERGLMNAPAGLVRTPPRPGGLLDPLVLPAVTGGGLLAQ